MKRLLFVLSLVILFACNKSNIHDKFTGVTEFPYIIGSELINEINSENYNELDPGDLKLLYIDAKKDYAYYESMIKSIIAVDSLKRMKVDENEIRSNYWDVFDNSIFALHKFKLNSGVTVYTWYIYTSDGNQGMGQVFITLFKDDTPYFCFDLPTTHSYSDYPVWTSTEATTKFMEDGKVIIEVNTENGEYDENDNESVSRIKSYRELKITNEGIQDIKSEQINLPDEEEEEEKVVNADYNDFDAITVGDGLKLRAEPSPDAEIITRYNTGELVSYTGETDSREILSDGSACDEYGYYWYKVKDARGTEGWAYGKYIYEISKPDEEGTSVFGKEYQLGDEMYLLDYAFDLSYGPDDENGLTGCDMFYMPYLYKDGSAVMPIYYDKEKFPSDDMGWKSEQFDGGLIYLVLSSEGGSDRITEVNEAIWEGNPALEFIISHGYQEGGAISTVLVSNITGKWEVVEYEYARGEY